jgi:hypothetical protein
MLSYSKLNKPQYVPYLAAIQAVMNQYIVPYAYLAMGYREGLVDTTLIGQYDTKASEKITEALELFGVSFTVAGTPITDGLRVNFTATRGTSTATGDHSITGSGPDFGPVYEQAKEIAKARWTSYTELLNPTLVRQILELANTGFERFILGDSPTPKQQLAAIKHKIKILAVNPTEYINRIRDAADKYEVGYQEGVSRYSYAIRWVGDGLVAAVKAAKSVLDVL